MEDKDLKRLNDELNSAIKSKILRKVVFSKSKDKNILKMTATPFERIGNMFFKTETFTKDGKNIQQIMDVKRFPEYVITKAVENFGQISLLADKKSLEVLISSKGKMHFSGGLEGSTAVEIAISQDKIKRYILTTENDGGFLIKLGIASENGQIHDKKQAKYRQINKFLEQIDAVYSELPVNKDLIVCDLCCGKSYLTFAVYWYFKFLKQRNITMYGVDLKKDVIEYCDTLAKKLNWDIVFSCGDVSKFVPEKDPDLVISLHACDIATDFVLSGAVKNKAKLILSTPCCHHQFNSEMKTNEFAFITDYSMLKQKLATAATDALRAKMLEIHGYKVSVCEFIDPEETPKNILIRAVRQEKEISKDIKIKKIQEYKDACKLLGIVPKLATLLPLED